MANYPYVQYQPPVWGNYAQAPANWNMPPSAPQQPLQAVSTTSVNTQPISQNGFVCRPVASEEEGRAVATDFSGLITVMPDFSHGSIYTKVLDPTTGSSVFRVYRQEAETETEKKEIVSDTVDYSPFFDSISRQIDNMNRRLDTLADKLEAKSSKASNKTNGKVSER